MFMLCSIRRVFVIEVVRSCFCLYCSCFYQCLLYRWVPSTAGASQRVSSVQKWVRELQDFHDQEVSV